MRITTFNVNSIRIRLDYMAEIIATVQPDILCLQETKTRDDYFPRQAMADLGYPYQYLYGIKGYNGVAIIARDQLVDVQPIDHCGRSDGRHIMARFGPGWPPILQGLAVHNLYVPAGGQEADPVRNEKFAHKLAFINSVIDFFAAGSSQDGQAGSKAGVLVGDLNIAPLVSDVWSHRVLRRTVSHTPVEIAALAKMRRRGGWVDAVRILRGTREKIYSWWSYRSSDFRCHNRGRRLDHIWVQPILRPSLVNASVLIASRGWDRPSDHVPLSVDLNL